MLDHGEREPLAHVQVEHPLEVEGLVRRRVRARGLREGGADVAEHDGHGHHVAGGLVVRREDGPHPKAQLGHVRRAYSGDGF